MHFYREICCSTRYVFLAHSILFVPAILFLLDFGGVLPSLSDVLMLDPGLEVVGVPFTVADAIQFLSYPIVIAFTFGICVFSGVGRAWIPAALLLLSVLSEDVVVLIFTAPGPL